MTIQIVSKALLEKDKPVAPFKEGFDITKKVRVAGAGAGGIVAEFIGSDNFAKQFYERQRYEIDSGREQEPLLYQPIYNTISDSSLPELIDIYTLGTTGVVFEKIEEGGEVKFITVGQGKKVVRIEQYAAGIEYSERLFMYNQLWQFAPIERQFGIAHNALQNHIHFYPILNHNYASANQTDGTTLTTFRQDASLPEKYLRVIEQAIIDSTQDTKNPRRGPFVVLCNPSDQFTFERALRIVPQQGFDLQSSAIGQVRTLISYNGWTGTRGKLATTYAGVPSGKAYLIDISNKMTDFQGYVKIPLRMTMGNPDVSRFIMAQTVYDTHFGVFADPVRAVQEITLPTPTSGQA